MTQQWRATNKPLTTAVKGILNFETIGACVCVRAHTHTFFCITWSKQVQHLTSDSWRYIPLPSLVKLRKASVKERDGGN